jgi:intracellular sulfur oxidation DsrE/DsrF family protein
MKTERAISDEFLNALVDDQLDSDEKDYALREANQNTEFRERVCELRALKEMVQHAYPQVADDAPRTRGWTGLRLSHLQSLAACFMLLLVGGASGWLAHDISSPASDNQMVHSLRALQQNDFAIRPSKYVVHVDTANPVRLKTALDEAENLLTTTQDTSQPSQVEIIANGPGLDLLRTGISPYAQRIALMQKKYPGLNFMACGQTIRKLKEQGIVVELLPHTEVTPSALEQIITRRLKQNWAYIKV